MRGHIGFFVVHLAAAEPGEGVVDGVSGDHFDYLRILFIEADALFSLQIVVEHVPHLNGRAFLARNGFGPSLVIVNQEPVEEVSDVGELAAFEFAGHCHLGHKRD